MKKYLSTLVLVLVVSYLQAQELRPFTPRFSIDTKGRLVYVTNNIITTKQHSGGTAVAYFQAPPSCPVSALCKNDGEYATNIDIDGDPSTFNSSSATLTVPDCSAIEFAGLYWGAGIAISQGNNGPLPMSPGNWNQIKFKAGTGTYQTITASVTDTVNVTFHGYQSFADVTELVRQSRSASYTIANVKCDSVNTSGQPIVNAYGGWNMIVIFRDSTQGLRNLTIFDGMAVVRNASGFTTRDITVTGFKCPPSGSVSAKLGVVVYDGDRGAIDGFLMKQNSDGVYVNQTAAGESADGTSGLADAWNSSITDTGSLVTSRIPAHQNTYGYDAHVYKLNNAGFKYLRNNDNSASIRINTTSEGYVLGIVTSEIDTYEPEMIIENGLQNLNGPILEKSDTVLINGTIKNDGTDIADQVFVKDSLPAYFKYVPGSVILEGSNKTDAAGDDEVTYNATSHVMTINIGTGSTAAGGGTVAANSTALYTYSYRVTISNNCADIGITRVALSQSSSLFYSGVSSGVAESTGSRPLSSNGCINPVGANVAVLPAGCNVVVPVRLVAFSAIATANGNLVNWTTEEHYDVKKYTLQSSADAVHFSDMYINNVTVRQGTFNYSYTDPKHYSGTVYYRLVMTGTDDNSIYSNIVWIRINNSASEVSLNPNPATGNTVTLFSGVKIQKLQWYDGKGALVKTTTNPVNGQLIAVGDLPAGLYFIKVYTNNEVTSIRLIKQ